MNIQFNRSKFWPSGPFQSVKPAARSNKGVLSVSASLGALYDLRFRISRRAKALFFGVLAGTMATAAMATNPPVSRYDSIQIQRGWSQSFLYSGAISVLANDSASLNSDANLLTASVSSMPMHGTLDFHSDGTFKYTHDGTSASSDMFTYDACDPNGCSNSRVDIVIKPASPIYLNVPGYTLQVTKGGDTSSLLSGSTTLRTWVTYFSPGLKFCTFPSCHIALTADAQHGNLTVNPDGTFHYAHDGSDTTSDSFVYEACVGTQCDRATVAVIVTTPEIGNYAIDLSAHTATCAPMSKGNVKCWGNNASGQLGYGKGSFEASGQALSVVNRIDETLTSIKSVTVGGDHSCALTKDGKVLCWGENMYGQLGRGQTDTLIHPPGYVNGLSPSDATVVTAISAGVSTTCALLNTNEVQCWGRNQVSQAGQPSSPYLLTATTVNLGTSAWSITSGLYHSCAQTSTGAMCWGLNNNGELGRSTGPSNWDVPNISVPGLAGIGRVTSGPSSQHNCALLLNGQMWCWGADSYGQLGDGTINAVGTYNPLLVSGNLVVSTVSTGAMNSCAITSNGAVSCWGYGGHGMLTNPANPPAMAIPQTTTIKSGASAVSVGFSHICAIVNGIPKCWGQNENAALGRGPKNISLADSPDPVDVLGF